MSHDQFQASHQSSQLFEHCVITSILGLRSLTRGLQDLWKRVFCDGTDRQTEGHPNSMTESAKWADLEKTYNSKILIWTGGMRENTGHPVCEELTQRSLVHRKTIRPCYTGLISFSPALSFNYKVAPPADIIITILHSAGWMSQISSGNTHQTPTKLFRSCNKVVIIWMRQV